ncbi:energy-coupling factor ABC transporter substrate-binding protein [Janibacter limosus]|uniref:energy-coupling factor ABC transporter substrate-binding protein n=1 Tax=Janibacter limosus TaxID=53458 RepID=UPI000836070A|nr:energy-coupling factor ABC transporter substrate-binding protein [Janibacter limosus]
MRESTLTFGRRGVALVLAAIVILLAVALYLGGRASAGDEEAFGGTDAAATAQLEEAGHEPWFQPLMPPAGGEIESGLFALQAGLGGVVLGYVFGRLRGRAPRPESVDTRS